MVSGKFSSYSFFIPLPAIPFSLLLMNENAVTFAQPESSLRWHVQFTHHKLNSPNRWIASPRLNARSRFHGSHGRFRESTPPRLAAIRGSTTADRGIRRRRGARRLQARKTPIVRAIGVLFMAALVQGHGYSKLGVPRTDGRDSHPRGVRWPEKCVAQVVLSRVGLRGDVLHLRECYRGQVYCGDGGRGRMRREQKRRAKRDTSKVGKDGSITGTGNGLTGNAGRLRRVTDHTPSAAADQATSGRHGRKRE